MEFQFDTQDYKVFIVSESLINKNFFEDIIYVLDEKSVNNLPSHFHNINSIEDARRWLDIVLEDAYLFIIQEKSSEKTIGFIFIHNLQQNDPHIGYVLTPDYWGKGIATKVLSGFIEHNKLNKKWNKLIAGVDKDNIASIGLLKKLGFLFKDETQSAYYFQYEM